jgi:hypothetical protein
MAAAAFDFITPFLTIWVRPRATIRKIVDSDPTRLVLLLAGTSCILNSLIVQYWLESFRRTSLQPVRYFASGMYVQWLLELYNPAGTWPSPGAELAAFIIAGAVCGVVLLYFYGAILKWTGRLFGGIGTAVEARAAFAWSQVLLIIAVISGLWSMKYSGMHQTPLVFFALVLWWLVALIKCVSEVHRFSAWRGLGAVVLWQCSLVLPTVLLIVISLGRSLILAA